MSQGNVKPLSEGARHFVRLFRLIRPYWLELSKGTALALVLGVVGMITPLLTKLLIDEVYPARDVTLMHVLVGGLLAVSISNALIGTVRGYYSVHVGARLNAATGLMFFNHLQHLPSRFFDTHRVGEIMSRFGDVRGAVGTATNVLQTVLSNAVYLLLVPPFLFLLQWKLALLALIGLPVTLGLTAVSGRVLRKHWRLSSEAYADLGALQVEVLSNIRTFKSMALESHVYGRARGQIEDALQTQLTAAGYAQILGLGTAVVRAANTALFSWFGWMLILGDQMTLGGFIAFSSYIGYLQRPLEQLVGLFGEFQQASVKLERMYEYLDTVPEADPAQAHHPPPRIAVDLRGRMELQQVTFGFAPGQPVLQDVSVAFLPGTITAIVGPSGAGKSTLLRLLTRMEEPQAGRVLVDGLPTTALPLHDLRRQVTAVWQEARPVRGTVWDNLTLGSQTSDRQRVLDAVRVARLTSVIEGLPEGLDTPVAEAGASLSGGQRQRLAIAAALVRDTPVLLLDEVTANIDVRTETEILEELVPLCRDKTVVFVTHRIGTARLADQIVVMDGGRIVGCGTHAELLVSCVGYRSMHNVGEPPSEVAPSGPVLRRG